MTQKCSDGIYEAAQTAPKMHDLDGGKCFALCKSPQSNIDMMLTPSGVSPSFLPGSGTVVNGLILPPILEGDPKTYLCKSVPGAAKTDDTAVTVNCSPYGQFTLLKNGKPWEPPQSGSYNTNTPSSVLCNKQ